MAIREGLKALLEEKKEIKQKEEIIRSKCKWLKEREDIAMMRNPILQGLAEKLKANGWAKCIGSYTVPLWISWLTRSQSVVRTSFEQFVSSCECVL